VTSFERLLVALGANGCVQTVETARPVLLRVIRNYNKRPNRLHTAELSPTTAACTYKHNTGTATDPRPPWPGAHVRWLW
jgi:hypothetical protein